MTKTSWRKKGKRQNQKRPPNPQWKDIVKENALLENYYKCQHIVPEEEWETFWKYCRRELPSTFRITKIRGHANDLLQSLRKGYISKISVEEIKQNKDTLSETVEQDDEESEQDLLLEPIKWYPNDLAWNSNLSRRFLRRSEILRKLHRFLVEDSECGAITRQEAVSMIPPMLLDVKPHHLVLDTCAAPGSKTAQIIEMMHDNDQNELPTGAVVANDADHKRCFLLTHQANRLNSHCVIVTNHDASQFPKLYSQNRKDKVPSKLLEFDRVLCDVPCSGDGTIRKNPLMWHKWTPHLGTSLHQLQIRILIRGLELLKVGGRLVYSTCSFNPIENEAVLAAVLIQSEESVELVDCSDELPGLERRPGMTTWKVFSKEGKEYETMESVDAEPKGGYKETMFPPSEGKTLNLERCMRIFPHLQNTGGFFIAVLHKKSELPWQKAKRLRYGKLLSAEESDKNSTHPNDLTDENLTHPNDLTDENLIHPNDLTASNPVLSHTSVEDSNTTSNTEIENLSKGSLSNEGSTSPPPKKKLKTGKFKEEPFIFLNDTNQELADVRNFYDLSADLPSHQFIIKNNQGKCRHIYMVSESIHKILSLNNNLKIINTGLRVVSRSPFKLGVNDHGIEYRLVQDGIHVISRFIKNRIVSIMHSDLVNLITSGDLDFESLHETTRQKLTDIDMGAIVCFYSSQSLQEGNSLTADIWLCGHYGRKIVQCMLTKEERKHYLRLLGVQIPEELQEKIKDPSCSGSKNKSEVLDVGDSKNVSEVMNMDDTKNYSEIINMDDTNNDSEVGNMDDTKSKVEVIL